MVEIRVTDRDGAIRTVHCPPGQSLMRALKGCGFDIQAICGGIHACSTCHVYVEPAWFVRLAPPHQDEIEMLDGGESFRRDASRLACQVPLTADLDGLVVTLAPED